MCNTAAAAVHEYGHVNGGGSQVYNTDVVVVPALHINLSMGSTIPILISLKSKTVEEGDKQPCKFNSAE